jgi:hypothetical protein
MTGLSDLVVLLIGKLYGRIQEHAPLPTIILALVCRAFAPPSKCSERSRISDFASLI